MEMRRRRIGRSSRAEMPQWARGGREGTGVGERGNRARNGTRPRTYLDNGQYVQFRQNKSR